MELVYISGPITGNENYQRQFAEADLLLRSKGYDVFNPAALNHADWTYNDYMKYDIRCLLDCDRIYMLKGWETSKGSRLEKRIADDLGIKELIL